MHLSAMKLNSVTFKTVGKCYSKYHSIQECIPVGCIPSVAVAVFGRGVSAGCLPGGCLPRRDVHPLPLWTEFLTHAWENITLPQLLLRTVTMYTRCIFMPKNDQLFCRILQTSAKGLALNIFP